MPSITFFFNLRNHFYDIYLSYVLLIFIYFRNSNYFSGRSISISLRQRQDAWFRNCSRGTTENIMDLFEGVISQAKRFGGWDLMCKGVMDLALSLLDTPQGFGRSETKMKMWNLGTDMLVRVFFHSPTVSLKVNWVPAPLRLLSSAKHLLSGCNFSDTLKTLL